MMSVRYREIPGRLVDLMRDRAHDLASIAKRTRTVLSTERRFQSFLDRIPSSIAARGTEHPVVVVVQPWWGSAEPWFMMALALLLQRRNGNTMVLYDDSTINWRDFGQPVEHMVIRRVLSRFPLPWRRLSDFDGTCPLSDRDVQFMARADAMKAYSGEAWFKRQRDHAVRVAEPLRRVGGHVERFFTDLEPSYTVVSTGFQATGALFPRIGARHRRRVATLDGNPGSRLLNVDGVAAHMTDIPRAMELIAPHDPWIFEVARAEWERRSQGRDVFKFQSVPLDENQGPPVGVLLPLNQSYDTSALDRSRFFSGQNDWLMQTVAWLIENTAATITVRQHPVERLYPGNDDYRARLNERFGDHPRIHLHDCNAKVNTYDLVRRAQVIVPHTSTVGVEATALGKPVVLEADTFYSELGFVHRAETREAYWQLIARGLRGELTVNDEQRRQAWLCYYVSQVCSFVPTRFTGWLEDFEQWSSETLDGLAQRDDVAMVLEALDGDIPLSVLRHRQFARERSSVKLSSG